AHVGRQSPNYHTRTPAWGPSPIPWTTSGHTPHAMTKREIREVIAAYVFTARLLRDAGFDGLEVHLGHGHLLHQFPSPATNTRADEYGGSEENRMRLSLEVLQAVIEAVGDRLVVGVRYSGEEFVEGGIDLPAAKRIIAALADRTPFQFVNVSHSAYVLPSIGLHVADMHYAPGSFRYIPFGIKEAVPHLPVFAICRFTTLAVADETLATGLVDMVGMTRAHIADPNIIAKTLAGREAEIRPCVSCNRCIGQLDHNLPITCMMNPTVGREREWAEPIPKTATPKRVLVIGGGPAGLEAARVAAERGNTVTIVEADHELGGQTRVGRLGHGRRDLDLLRAYYERELARLQVTIRLGVTATAADTADADTVIVAVGSRPTDQTLPGYGRLAPVAEALPHVADFAGQHVVIVDSTGSWATASAAESLAAAGARVTLLTRADSILWDINMYSKATYIDRLSKLGVMTRTLREPVIYREGDLVVRDVVGRVDEVIAGVDRILVSAPNTVDQSLQIALEESGATVVTIGDAQAPRSILEAIFEGHVAGRAC
ncbi:MAG: FAD-dependent oxidoreductase, partial [Dehalococcoidia bacterium]|nr:FAD-dependent oxidoreductase [Dehalococcoidia bacterium]